MSGPCAALQCSVAHPEQGQGSHCLTWAAYCFFVVLWLLLFNSAMYNVLTSCSICLMRCTFKGGDGAVQGVSLSYGTCLKVSGGGRVGLKSGSGWLCCCWWSLGSVTGSGIWIVLWERLQPMTTFKTCRGAQKTYQCLSSSLEVQNCSNEEISNACTLLQRYDK